MFIPNPSALSFPLLDYARFLAEDANRRRRRRRRLDHGNGFHVSERDACFPPAGYGSLVLARRPLLPELRRLAAAAT